MDKNDLKNKHVQKRLQAYKKYILARDNFIEIEKRARTDLKECNRIIKSLSNKLKWLGSIP